ncbi:MAG TPA: hypothetical protein VGO40_00305, partial [Longimicrobium sp.]|nr:hypothetical protein [Longimicrobium sp.]
MDEIGTKERAGDEPLWRAPSQGERLAELTADDATLKEAPLRRDVRSLRCRRRSRSRSRVKRIVPAEKIPRSTYLSTNR